MIDEREEFRHAAFDQYRGPAVKGLLERTVQWYRGIPLLSAVFGPHLYDAE